MTAKRELDAMLVLRAAVRDAVLSCETCRGSGRVLDGRAAGMSCPCCARQRHALAYTASVAAAAAREALEAAE